MNKTIHDSTGFTPYRLMFPKEAVLPLDAVLKLDTSSPQRGAQYYPDYVIQQKKQLEETEHILRVAQTTQKAYYDTISAVSCRRPSLVSKLNQVKEDKIPQTLVWSLEGCESPV